jgi:hypothetical protein
MTARMSVRRLPPPRLAGGINASTEPDMQIARIRIFINEPLRPRNT